MSDRYFTDYCGVLDYLFTGDILMADRRGFNISDSAAMIQASLNIPVFTKCHSQLSAVEVHEYSKHCQCKVTY